MSDGSRWGVPVKLIAMDRAKVYAEDFGGDVERSLIEDTQPFFADDFEIYDWAANNMNWEDVAADATRLPDAAAHPSDYQECWVNGEKELI